MKRFFSQLIRFRFLILSIFIVLAFWGYRSYNKVPIDAFPDITPKQVVIYTESPGNAAEDIERLVTYPIESAMAGLPGVRKILSNSMFGLSYIAIFFEENYDIYFLRNLVSQRLATIDLPEGWGKPELGPNTTGLGQVLWYSIEDKNHTKSLSELRLLHRYFIAPILKTVPGVEEVITWGGFEKQFEVRIDPLKLTKHGITYDEVVRTLKRNNLSAGGQYLEFNREQYLIRADGRFEDIKDIADSVIATKNGAAIRIKDIADVGIGKAPRFGAVSVDGKERVFAMVLQRTGTNAAEVVERLKQKIQEITPALPEGVEVRILYDRSSITKKAVDTMQKALLSGAVLVIIVLFLFLFELRSALIVTLSLPLALLIAFILMRTFEMSANLMSLSGLAIAIGMIVDGTIVVVENSYRLLHKMPDRPKAEVIAQAVAEVAKPILFALLIIMAVFIPLLSLGGLAGKLYAPMAINIIFAMSASLLIALLLIPVLSYLFLKPSKKEHSLLMRAILKLYTPILERSMRYAPLLLLAASLLFGYLLYALMHQGKEFMPKLNEESIMYRVIAIPGTALTQNIEHAQAIENFILTDYGDKIESVLSMIGRSEKGETAQANYMEVLLIPKQTTHDIEQLGKRITRALKERFSHLQFIPTQPIAMRIEELLEGVQAELAVKIYGEDQRTLSKLASEIQKRLKSIKGVEEIEIESQLGQSQLLIRPDRLMLARYNLDTKLITDFVRYGVAQEPVTTLFDGVRRYGVVATIDNALDNPKSLHKLPLLSQKGDIATLGEVADIRMLQGPAFIKRENLNRYMVLSIEVKGRDIVGFVNEADRIIKQSLSFPQGYYYTWAGEFRSLQEANQTLMIIIPGVLALILLLLHTAFGSLKKAIVIVLGVPLGLIGSIIALLYADIYLSISAIIGFIAIFAIAVLNGIVLVSFIDELEKNEPDLSVSKRVQQATLMRLRPVLMTAATTLFGILPLLYVSGVGSEIQYPLAVVVTGGIITSTLLTLLLLPGLYLLFFKDKK